MKLFSRKEDKSEEHAMNQALAERSRPETNVGEDELQALSKLYYMMTSKDVDDMLIKGLGDSDKKSPLKMLFPAYAGINRTCKIGKKDAKILMRKYRILRLLFETTMDEDDFNELGWGLMESLSIYAHGIVADQYEGWKGTLLTEQVKVLRTEIKKEKKGLLPF